MLLAVQRTLERVMIVRKRTGNSHVNSCIFDVGVQRSRVLEFMGAMALPSTFIQQRC
jgi:hypothetical protein